MLINPQQMLLKLLQKFVEATGDLIGNKIAEKIAKVLKTSQQIIIKTVTKQYDKEILKEKEKIIDDLRLI